MWTATVCHRTKLKESKNVSKKKIEEKQTFILEQKILQSHQSRLA